MRRSWYGVLFKLFSCSNPLSLGIGDPIEVQPPWCGGGAVIPVIALLLGACRLALEMAESRNIRKPLLGQETPSRLSWLVGANVLPLLDK